LQLRQLGDIHRNPSRLVFAKQLGLVSSVNPLAAYIRPHSPAIASAGVGGMSNQQLQSLSFGAIDRPACRYCGEQTYLTRRTPHPDHDLRYELQIFTCSACDHTIERIVDANGNSPEKLKCCD
jgi:hypothetical protein